MKKKPRDLGKEIEELFEWLRKDLESAPLEETFVLGKPCLISATALAKQVKTPPALLAKMIRRRLISPDFIFERGTLFYVSRLRELKKTVAAIRKDKSVFGDTEGAGLEPPLSG